MHLACSSAFHGGGTNQELAHHCLHQCKGDVMVSTAAFLPLLFSALRRGGVSATLRQDLWIFLVEISGPGDQRWSSVVRETTYGGVSKRPHSCSSSPSFRMHRQPLLQRIHVFVRSAASRKAAPDT